MMATHTQDEVFERVNISQLWKKVPFKEGEHAVDGV